MAPAGRPAWAGGNRVPSEYSVSPKTRTVFRKALQVMNRVGPHYVVGGAFALHWYTGFWRVAKDLDLFVLPEQVEQAMTALSSAGFATRVKHPEWLADALMEDHKVDLIYGMGNWAAFVDTDYMEKGAQAVILGVRCRVASAEDMIHSKAFVASRDRYDAADVYHLLVAMGEQLDWHRLLARFGDDWEVLLSHLVMFRYVYPSHRDVVPGWVLEELLVRSGQTMDEPWLDGKLCRGFLLDGNGSYSQDIQEWGYRDAREEAWKALLRRSAA